MRVVLEHRNGEIWGQHEIEGVAAEHLLKVLSSPSDDRRGGSQAVDSLVEALRVGSLAEIARGQEREARVVTVDFTDSELAILSEALESYWFDCAQGGDDDLKAKQPAIDALSERIVQVRLNVGANNQFPST